MPVYIPATEMWMDEARPDYVLQNMMGSTIDFIITKVDREGGYAIASRRQASRDPRTGTRNPHAGRSSCTYTPCRPAGCRTPRRRTSRRSPHSGGCPRDDAAPPPQRGWSFFAHRPDLCAEGARVKCRLLAVGPRRCLAECYGHDIDLTQRELSYSNRCTTSVT